MDVEKVHCFFEQSGIFKNEFIKLGIPAEDYDIQNEFGQTDYVIDLFAEIEKGYANEASIFDNIQGGDLVMAFFPCIYFCENNQLYFIGEHLALRKCSIREKTNRIINRAREREKFYELILKFFAICEQREIKLIVENPYAVQHYLVGNFPYKAKLIDKDRTLRGDLFKKPTQYWFVNCEPTNGCSYAPTPKKNIKIIQKAKSNKTIGLCSEERSMISPDYARNFICDFIIGKPQENLTQLSLF